MTAWRYTMLAAGSGGDDGVGVVIQIGDLGPADGYIHVSECVTDANMPPFPSDGIWLWLDTGTTVSTGGEYPDEAEPAWRGAWVSLAQHHVEALAKLGRVTFDTTTAVERERNDAVARIESLALDLYVAHGERDDRRRFVDELLPLLSEVVPGREAAVGVPQAVAEAIAEVRRLRGKQTQMPSGDERQHLPRCGRCRCPIEPGEHRSVWIGQTVSGHSMLAEPDRHEYAEDCVNALLRARGT